jgi:hypothetical protein
VQNLALWLHPRRRVTLVDVAQITEFQPLFYMIDSSGVTHPAESESVLSYMLEGIRVL